MQESCSYSSGLERRRLRSSRQLLPSNVVVRTCPGTWNGGAELLPTEEGAVATAVDRRRHEFAVGRACARAALSELGVPPCPIPSGLHREPLWPPAVVGSITHCPGFCAAAVAFRASYHSIGIDAEIDEALPPGLLAYIAVDEEQSWLTGAPGDIHWDRLLFSAKESIFKAWFPLTGAWLGFQDAMVTFTANDHAFRARLSRPLPHTCGGTRELRGRFMFADGLIFTAVLV
ncbi:4'-phosphopantetheinyl transferase superfamily protein [Bradyrhizobium arachidis]|uniref:4'-phosphopantetheinyl transferase family protein n=1 Tax=Bradyrhizobium arachidis TaxID=858423 RepID=UPI002867C146|nr:4'-phosphopantetheinyl transferase superfamily protein [Bradyrhizobium arachidis]